MKFVVAFHRQTEIVNHSLGDLLKFLMGEKSGNRDLLLPTVEFTYNNSVSRSTGKFPFQIVYGLAPCQPIDLVLLSHDFCPYEYAESFAHHIRDLYVKIRCKIAISNETYKLTANVHCRN